MSSMIQIQTPNFTISAALQIPTCPPAPQRRDAISKSLAQELDSCPQIPELPFSPDADVTSSIKRLMPRPRFVEMPYWRRSVDFETADTAYAACSNSGMTAVENLLHTFENQNINREDLDERRAKRARRTSLLDGLPPQRASFAGVA